jgi:hypothetical protein
MLSRSRVRTFGLYHQVLDFAESFVPLGFVELGVGVGAFLRLAHSGPILVPVHRQVEGDEQSDVWEPASRPRRLGVRLLHIHIGQAQGVIGVEPLAGQLDGIFVAGSLDRDDFPDLEWNLADFC